MNPRFTILIIMSCAVWLSTQAQDSFEEFRKNANAYFEQFRKESNDEYESFRKKINDEYAAMLEKAWKEFDLFSGHKIPDDKVKPVPPVVFPKDDKNKPKPKPLPFDTIVPIPKPTPQPQPVVPIEEKPMPKVSPKVEFTFFGTLAAVHFDTSAKYLLTSINEKGISKAWNDMSTSNYSNLVHDCLQIRNDKDLCDWAYLEMLHALGEHLYGTGSNDATLLMAYIYCQSGYKMRLARDDGGKLHMLFSSQHLLYNVSYLVSGGETYYLYGEKPSGQIYLCNVSFPNETPMSLLIPHEVLLSQRSSQPKTRQSQRYPNVKTSLVSNLNLMDFYETYPTSMIGDNMVSRWAMYANTPMSERVKEQIYPALKAAIAGNDQLLAVNKLLNYVQTGFVYEYDDKVWGHDRAFFAEESLYYPYCDCEDRSILFTRLVRDLLGLKCILIYYPGHLASAVEFTQGNVAGDYINLNGRKFIIADGTYINAPVGRTMPNMDNRTAKVILLE